MKRLILAALLAATTTTAFAAPPAPMASNTMAPSSSAPAATTTGASTPAPGAGAANPAMVKMMGVCKADFAKLCPGKGAGPEMRQCVQENYGSLSEPCQGAIMEMMQSRGAG